MQQLEPPKRKAILSRSQVHALNTKGAGLNEGKGKMYLQAFLINTDQNTANDPIPFKIHESFFPRLVKTALGKPWIPKPMPGDRHARPLGAAGEDADSIKEFQQQFSAGEIVAQYINPDTGNANVIIDVFPEYQDKVRAGDVAPLVSPMVWGKVEADGNIYDGEILHLHGVNQSGYDPRFAKINSVCEGNGLKHCMQEMRAMGAAGTLGSFQKQVRHYVKNRVSPHDKKIINGITIGKGRNTYDAKTGNIKLSSTYQKQFQNPQPLPIVVQHELGHAYWRKKLGPKQRLQFAREIPKQLSITPYAKEHSNILVKAMQTYQANKTPQNKKNALVALGQYVREIFAILHSLVKEPNAALNVKRYGLQNALTIYQKAMTV